MVYIVTEESDITSDYVSEYLFSNKCEFIRINVEDETQLSLSLNNFSNVIIKINNNEISKNDIIWIRRARFSFIPNDIFSLRKEMLNYLYSEQHSLIKSLEFLLKSNFRLIGSYSAEVGNHKIKNLYIAKLAGFRIPNSLVATNKEEILMFLNKNDYSVITKDLRYPVNFNLDESSYSSIGTIEISIEDLDSIDDFNFPVFLQQKIQKLLEIRVFIFYDHIYSMAIFSQNNEETKTDYRNYTPNNHNRFTPFKLPSKIIKSIKLFMKMLNLNTGSIDLILTKQMDYIFLEINPQGQFDWLSKNCNFYIEKHISEFLCQKKTN